MKRSLLALLFCCLLAPLTMRAVQADEPKPITLRYKMSDRDTLFYRSTVKSKDTQTFGQQKVVTDFSQTDIAKRTLNKIDEAGNLHITSENMLLQVDVNIGPVGKYKFDSKELEHEKGSLLGASLTPIYESLRGAYMDFTLSPRGQVKAVSGLQDLLKEVLKDNPLGERFVAGGTDEGFKVSMSDLFVHFPEKPLSPGDNWEADFEVPVPKVGNVKGKNIYTYHGPDKVGERPTVKITVETEISIELDIKSDEADVSGSLSTTQSDGTIHFDPELGQIITKKARTTLSGNLTVVAGGQTIPFQKEQKTEVDIALLDELPE